jgi:hypothetical protein
MEKRLEISPGHILRPVAVVLVSGEGLTQRHTQAALPPTLDADDVTEQFAGVPLASIARVMITCPPLSSRVISSSIPTRLAGSSMASFTTKERSPLPALNSRSTVPPRVFFYVR